MKIVATIDTNVIVSSLIKIDSYPGTVIEKVYSGELIPVLNQDIIYEYIHVLTREKFNFNKARISKMINKLIDKCIFAEKSKTNEYFIDEDDVVFYEVTMSVRKAHNAYLVTGNKKHFPMKPFVVSPKELCEIIEKSN